MKKILSLIMVLALVLSLGIPAFAVENTGSITIKNATIGQVYKLYRLFDANYSGDAVSYSLEKDSQFYPALFDDNGNPVAGNTFFTYNVDTKEVKKVKGVNDTDLVNYVKEIIQNGNFETEVLPEEADSTTVSFDNIPFGYYVIDIDDAGGVITITSNTPDAEVIDKNQVPLTGGIEKQVWDADKGQWAEHNYAFVGDVVKYRVKFNATNYAGIEQIHY